MNNKENISAVTKHVFIKYMSIYDVSTCNYLTLTLRFYIFYYIGVFKKKEKKSRHYFAIYYIFLQQIVQYTTKQQNILIKITE